MSKSKKNTRKKIPVLNRKHVRSDTDSLVNSTNEVALNSPEFRSALNNALSESINKALPSIIEQVIKELESKAE